MKIEEILKMHDVSEIHEFVKLYLHESTKSTNLKFNIFNYTSKDKQRQPFTGVYHKDGHRIATDRHILVDIVEKYPEEYECKIIGKDGKEIEAKFPNYEADLPTENLTPVELDKDYIDSEYKKYKIEKKALSKNEINPFYKTKIGNFYYNTDYLKQKVLPFYERLYGNCVTSEKGIIMINNDLDERLILMPIISYD